MATPQFLTFTGVDELTSLDGMEALSRTYPIEWGVLFSADRQGIDPRYPDLRFVGAVLERRGLRLAAHICGDHSLMLISDCDDPRLYWMMRTTPGDFGRIQVNTDPKWNPSVRALSKWAEARKARLVLQTRGAFPGNALCDWLFDKSGGKGISPLRWPRPVGIHDLVGYAGGLGPEIVASQLKLISGEAPFWLDMESGIRTHNNLDLAKCRKVCEAVYG